MWTLERRQEASGGDPMMGVEPQQEREGECGVRWRCPTPAGPPGNNPGCPTPPVGDLTLSFVQAIFLYLTD